MSTHTPGPWKYGSSSLMIFAANSEINVATIPKRGWDSDEANARLIAAAPEMLSALREIAEHSLFYNNPGSSMQAIAKHAIAKATGRPQ